VQQLLAKAHDRARQPAGALQHMDLAANDERHRARAHGRRLPVDQVLAASAARPEQLVVVVAMGLARTAGGRAERRVVQLDDLDRGGAVRQAVHRQVMRRRRHRRERYAQEVHASGSACHSAAGARPPSSGS
jgi:hypothetical protein